MRYRVIVWCAACRDDDDGCFNGGSQVIGRAYGSREAAARIAAAYCEGLPYLYRIEEDEPATAECAQQG